MKCDLCGTNEATVHLTEIINDQKNELHLCEGCAEGRSQEIKSQFGLKELLGGLAAIGLPAEVETRTKAKCPSCGMGWSDFRRIARFGCSDCYGAFKAQLGPLLKRIHGATMHLGKSPVAVAAKPKEALRELKAELAKAIQEERFEDAVKLRDRIRAVERQGQG